MNVEEPGPLLMNCTPALASTVSSWGRYYYLQLLTSHFKLMNPGGEIGG